MIKHYGISQDQFDQLAKKNITLLDLFEGVKEFNASNAQVSKISLMHYIDKHGDFTERKRKLDHVACVVFENLPLDEKIEVANYIEWIEGQMK